MSAASDETKLCPMCGREIKAVARKCRFCGEMLDGTSADAAGIWREGRLLVMRKDAELPYRCIKTNTPADVWLKRDLSWAPWWVLALLLMSLPIGLIAYLLAGKRAKIRIGLCEQRRAARVRAIWLAWLLALLGIGLFIVGGVSADAQPNTPLVYLIPAGILSLLIALLMGATLPHVVRAQKISKEHIWLKGVHPDYLAEFPEFL
ncbi:MAG: hypothetical protein ACKOGA_23235, partial [Planctomycetaceae bacterium]